MENHTNWAAVLVHRKEDTFTDLESRLDDLASQETVPSVISVIIEFRDPHILNEVEKILNDRKIPVWYMQHAREEMFDLLLQVDSAFNISIKNQYVFYSVFENSQKIPANFYQKVIEYCTGIDRFFAIMYNDTTQDIHCHTVHSMAHKKFNGNYTSSMLEKVTTAEPDSITKYDEIFGNTYEKTYQSNL